MVPEKIVHYGETKDTEKEIRVRVKILASLKKIVHHGDTESTEKRLGLTPLEKRARRQEKIVSKSSRLSTLAVKCLVF